MKKTSPAKPNEKKVSVEAVPLSTVKKSRRGPTTVIIEHLNVITGPLRQMKDPLRRICYEPLLDHYEERYRSKFKKSHHAKWVLVLDLVLLAIAGALAVAGFLFWFILPAFPSAKTVSLELLTPQHVTSGTPTTILLSYRNESGETLTGAKLRLNLPTGFYPDLPIAEATPDAEPASVTVREYELGDIPPNGQGRAALSGAFYSPIGSSQRLTAELSYWPSGDAQVKRLNAFYDLPVDDAALQVGLQADQKLMRGRQTTVVINYANAGPRPLNAVISLNPPADFVMTGSRPSATMQEWRLGELAAGQRGSIEVYGFFRSNSSGEASTFNVRAETTVGDERRLVQELRQDLFAQANGFNFHLEVSQPPGLAALRPGDDFAVTVRYGNDGQASLRDLLITLTADPTGLLDAADELTTTINEVQPGENGTVTFRLRLPSDLDWTKFAGLSRHVSAVARARYVTDDDLTRVFLGESETVTLPIATELGLKGKVVYYTSDGEQLGAGPLPPQVGETTRYWVVLNASSSTGDIADVKLECQLVPGVTWTERYSVTSGRSLAHIPTTGRIVWETGHIPAGADGGGSRVAASFEIAVMPTANDAEKRLKVVQDCLISGTDVATGLKLSHTLAEILTEEAVKR